MAGLSVWNGSSFVDGEPRIWNGSAFVAPSEAYVWQGGQFIKVWPSWAYDISYVNSSTTQGTSISIPSHQAGDLLFMLGMRDGNNTAPSVPAGWTELHRGGNNNQAMTLAYRIAPSSGTSSGTWSNANRLVAAVYRSGRGFDSVTVAGVNSGNNQTVNYPAATADEHLVIRAGTAQLAGNFLSNTPSGFTQRGGNANNNPARIMDSNGPMSGAVAAANQSINTFTGWRAATILVRNA